MKIRIVVKTLKEDTTPEEAEKTGGFTKGYAASVRKNIKNAKTLDPKSRWGWCTVKVSAIVEIGGIALRGEDYLGACSHTSELDFVRNSGYFNDMVSRAISLAVESFNMETAKKQSKFLQSLVG